MSVPIVAFPEFLVTLGLTSPTAQQNALAAMVHRRAESAVRGYIGYDPVQAEHTEFYPACVVSGCAEVHDCAGFEFINHVDNSHVHWASDDGEGTDRLCVKNLPVRSVASIYEDINAYAAQGSSPYPASTLLTSGTDYFIDLDQSGLGRSGIIYRIGSCWPNVSRSVKITYTAGWTQTELMSGEAAAISMAVLLTANRMFTMFAARWSGSGSSVPLATGLKRELLGDYEYELHAPAEGNDLASFGPDPGIVPDAAKELLEPYVHFWFMCTN